MSDAVNAINWLTTHLKGLVEHGEWLSKIESLENYERELQDRIANYTKHIDEMVQDLGIQNETFEKAKASCQNYIDAAVKQVEDTVASGKAKEAEIVSHATQVAEGIIKSAEEAAKALQDAMMEKTTEYNLLLQSIAEKTALEESITSRLNDLKKMF